MLLFTRFNTPTLTSKMKSFTRTFCLLAAAVPAMSLHGHAATVFNEDFNAPDNTAIIGWTPAIGQAWTGSADAESGIIAGSFNSSGISVFAHAYFTSALGTGQILTLSFETLPLASGTYFGSGYAGISLYQGESEIEFIGDLTGSTSWGLNGPIAAVVTADTTAATTATFTYVYDTGAWTFTTGSGVDLSGTGQSQVEFDRLRLAQDVGSSIHVDNITVDISAVPEPSVALLSGTLLLGLGIRRRR